jgi:hypothetical protein
MSNQYLHHIQKLTMKLQRALEEDRTRLDRVRSNPSALGDPFELERTRRSAAPSPEAFLGDNRGHIQGKLLGNGPCAPTLGFSGTLVC